MTEKNVRLNLEVEQAGWSRGLATATSALNAFDSNVGARIGSVDKKMLALKTGTAAVGAGIALGLAKATGAAIEFEAAFAGVKKTVDGTEAQLETIRRGLLDMSGAMPTAATELAGIAEAAGQLGIAAPDVLEFTETIARLGETTDLDFDSAATQLAQFLNITGSGAGTVGELADVIVDLGNNSATTESKIVSFGQRLAAAGSLLGLTDSEILAVAAAFSSMGIEAEAGGTAISRVFKELYSLGVAADTSSPKLQTFAETAGVTADEFLRLAQQDPDAAFESFIVGLGRVNAEGGDVIAVLDDLGFSGERVQMALLGAAVNSDVLSSALDRGQAAYGNGAAQDEFNKRLETTAAQVEILGNKLTALAIDAGAGGMALVLAGVLALSDGLDFLVDAMGPAATEIAAFVASLVEFGAAAAGAFGGPALQAAGTLLVGLATALETVFSALNQIPGAAETVGVALAALTVVSLFGGVGTIVSTFGAMTTGLAATSAAFVTTTAAASSTAAALGTVALAAAPLIGLAAAGAVLAAVALDMLQLKQAAAETDRVLDSYRTDADGFTTLTTLRQTVEATNSTIRTSGDILGGWGNKLDAVAGLLPGVADETNRARVALAAAGEAGQTAAADYETLSESLALAGLGFGYTTTEIEAIAVAAGIDPGGLLDPATWLQTVDAIYFAVEAFAATEESAAAMAAAFGTTYDAVADGSQTVAEFADSLGLAGSEMAFLAEKFNIDLDSEDIVAAKLALAGAASAAAEAAESVGVAGDAYIAAGAAALDLAAASGALGRALAGVATRQDQMLLQSRALADAQAAVAEAMAAGDVTGLAVAYGQLNAAQATYATGAGEVGANTLAAVEAFTEFARAAGATEEEIALLVGQLIILDAESTVDLQVAGGEQITEVEESTRLAIAALIEMSASAWTAEVEADTDGAREQVAALAIQLGAWDQTTATAFLEADGATAVAMFNDLVSAAASFDGQRYEAEVEVRDSATMILDEIEAGLARIRDKSVNVSVSTNGTVRRASGGGGGNTYLADGAIVLADGGMVRERPGAARIYQPTARNRIFAEPETGGEAYIPLHSSKRRRSTAIWRETGRRLGVMADGGIMADSASFAGGGITSGVFADSSGLPSVSVGVQIDTRSLGVLFAPLGGLKAAVAEVDRSIGDASQTAAEFGVLWEHAATESTRAWTGVGDNIGREFRTAEASVERTARNMLEAMRPADFLATFSEISGWAETEFVKWLGPWDGTVESALRKLDSAGLEMRHIWRDVAAGAEVSANDMLAAVIGVTGEMSAEVVEAGREMVEALDPDAFAARLEAMAGINASTWDQIAADAGRSTDDITATTRDMIRALEGAGFDLEGIFYDVFTSSADAVDIFTVALAGPLDALSTLDGRIRDVERSSEALGSSYLDLADAQGGVISATDRLDSALERSNGKIGDGTVEGERARDALIKLGQAYVDVALESARAGEGADVASEALRRGEEEFRRIAEQAGISSGVIDQMTDALFNIPNEVIVELAAEGDAAQEEVQKLRDVLADTVGADYTVGIGADPADAQTQIVTITEQLGTLVNGQYVAVIDANGQPASGVIATVNGELVALVGGSYVPVLDANGEPARSEIRDIDNRLVAIGGRTVSPTVHANTGAAAGALQDIINRLNGINSKTITVTTRNQVFNEIQEVRQAPTYVHWNTGAGYADGGIHGRSFAAGGFLPSSAMIAPPSGTNGLVQWAEASTGGEAFIPLASAKRARSTVILGQVADEFGYRLAPKGDGRNLSVLIAPRLTVAVDASGRTMTADDIEAATTRAARAALADFGGNLERGLNLMGAR